jgi:predicted ferric reductase
MHPRRALGPALVAILWVVPVLLWATAAPLEPRFADLSTSLTSIAVALALAGVAAFAVNLVLGARIRFADHLFGGLDKLFAFHRFNGRVAFLLIAGHALLIVASRATISWDSALDLLSTSGGFVIIYGIVALIAMTIAIGLTLYARLSHEVFIYVQRSFGVIFLVACLHVFMTSGIKASSPALTIYLGVLTAAGVAAWIYRSVFGNLLVRRHDYLVTGVRQLDNWVVEITMTPRAGRPLDYVPGQFVFVTFFSSEFNAQFHPVSIEHEGEYAIVTLRPGEVSNQFHPFSLTSAPGEGNLRIAVKAVGDFTRAMHKLGEGAVAKVEGPYGGFSHLKVPRKRQVWVAGGIGITPFLSMVRSLNGSGHQIDLYFGVKSLDQSYFLAELLALDRTRDDFRLIHVPEDEIGYITADRIEETTGDLKSVDFLLCGPPPMVKNLRGQLIDKGVPRSHIHFEKFALGQPRQ